jgi:preprotein translocase subunit SecA
VVREDRNDLIFRTKREKYNAILDEIERMNKLELPVLVGTTNVDVSETLARMLKRRGIRHNVLNAKQHAREADIIAAAGQPGAVTIATNMAGRGTDIKLGAGVTDAAHGGVGQGEGARPGNPGPPRSRPMGGPCQATGRSSHRPGGLQILGSERHESRRIDRQLRGRAGRQGDPGSSQFFLSLEDDLMRLFGSERIANAMEKWGAEEGEVITHGLVTKSIERAQRRVEGNNFEARKRLLDYDDVMNQQREVIYDLRLFALDGGEDLRGRVVGDGGHGGPRSGGRVRGPRRSRPESWDMAGLRRRLLMDFFIMADTLPEKEEDPFDFVDRDEVMEAVIPAARKQFERKLEDFGEYSEKIQSWILLSVIDDKWKDHLYDLDSLKASISFRGWGQKDPLIEYKKEAYDMFVDLMTDIRKTLTSLFYRAQVGAPQPQPRQPQRLAYSGPAESDAASGAGAASSPRPRQDPRGARLDPVGVAASARTSTPTQPEGQPEPVPGSWRAQAGPTPRPSRPTAAGPAPPRNPSAFPTSLEETTRAPAAAARNTRSATGGRAEVFCGAPGARGQAPGAMPRQAHGARKGPARGPQGGLRRTTGPRRSDPTLPSPSGILTLC